MAFNLLSGKLEPGDWSCGAAGELDEPDVVKRARPSMKEPVAFGLMLGAGLGCLYLYWQEDRARSRAPLPENRLGRHGL